jgi:hypothetical protein
MVWKIGRKLAKMTSFTYRQRKFIDYFMLTAYRSSSDLFCVPDFAIFFIMMKSLCFADFAGENQEQNGCLCSDTVLLTAGKMKSSFNKK